MGIQDDQFQVFLTPESVKQQLMWADSRENSRLECSVSVYRADVGGQAQGSPLNGFAHRPRMCLLGVLMPTSERQKLGNNLPRSACQFVMTNSHKLLVLYNETSRK